MYGSDIPFFNIVRSEANDALFSLKMMTATTTTCSRSGPPWRLLRIKLTASDDLIGGQPFIISFYFFVTLILFNGTVIFIHI